MTSTNLMTYADGAVYTMYFTLNNFIPIGGYLYVNLPDQVSIVGSATTDFKTDTGMNFASNTANQIQLKASTKILAGDYFITFGGVKNPRSEAATDIFSMRSTDNDNKEIGYGTIDNIMMTNPGAFKTI
jgi:hypothetical protein